MTEAERTLIADLAARIERLEARLAELDPLKPTKTSLCLYPKQPHEK